MGLEVVGVLVRVVPVEVVPLLDGVELSDALDELLLVQVVLPVQE